MNNCSRSIQKHDNQFLYAMITIKYENIHFDFHISFMVTRSCYGSNLLFILLRCFVTEKPISHNLVKNDTLRISTHQSNIGCGIQDR